MVDYMSYLAYRDFALEVARGNISGVTAVNKFGRITDLDTAEKDIWDNGPTTGTWAAPTQARTHQLVSTSTDDDLVGTGARQVRVYGLQTWDSAESNELVDMDGTTDSATANTYVIIHRMVVEAWGNAGPNVGTITATADTDNTVTAQINADEGQTQMAIYGIPSTKTAYMSAYYASVNKAAQSVTVDIALLFNPIPDTDETAFIVKHTQAIASTGLNYMRHEFNPYNKFDGPGILKMSGDSSAVNADVSAGFDLFIIDD